jgi:hypothetical protein
MSSITWNARPSARPKALTATSCFALTLTAIAPSRIEAVRSAADPKLALAH